MTYSVIENRNIGTLGNPIMHETVLYRGNKEEKEEKVVIDGKTYFKAAYEFYNK